jgi:hypothetical protein
VCAAAQEDKRGSLARTGCQIFCFIGNHGERIDSVPMIANETEYLCQMERALSRSDLPIEQGPRGLGTLARTPNPLKGTVDWDSYTRPRV